MKHLYLLKYCAASLLLLLGSHSLLAATFYVNADSGDDTRTGLAPTISGTAIGPWKTLAKVATADLQPGDVVLLSCGQKWTESIRVSRSGTAAQPITFGSWPVNCNNPPLVDGSVSVPSHSWTQTSDPKVWRTSWPANLISNANFTGGNLGAWTSWSDVGNPPLSVSGTCTPEGGECLRFDAGSFQRAALLISNPFAIDSGRKYLVKFRLKMPAGRSAKILTRRNAAPWDLSGLQHTVTGSGEWAAYSLTFTATQSMANARLDLELRDIHASPLAITGVSVAPVVGTPMAITINGAEQIPAHHPNGSDTSPATSAYFSIAADSPWHYVNVTPVSNSFSVNSDLQLPQNAALTAGVGVSLRSRAWALEEHTIGSVEGNTVRLAKDTSYNLSKGWGYFLTNAAWMVDSPGEWFYNSAASQLIVRPDNDAPPGARVRATQLDVGIYAVGVSNLTFKNISIRAVGNGVDATGSANVILDNMTIDETEQHGVTFTRSNAITLTNSRITNSRLDSVAGTAFGKVSAKNAKVSDNTIEGSGVASSSAAGSRLPAPSRAAVHAGEYAIVERNRISRTAYVGIRSDKGSSVLSNYLKDTCLVLDDGGAIYIKSTDNNGTVSGNIIQNVLGNIDGKPMKVTHAVGIYVDDWTSGVTVSNNSVINADHGMQVHNAFNNLIVGNTFYSNRMDEMWLQENENRKDPTGDVHSNVISKNLFVPLVPHAPVFHISTYGVPHRFAQYSDNIYSQLLSPLTSTEAWPDALGIMRYTPYTLPQWQSAAYGGLSRNLDSGARPITLQNYAQYTVQGPNLIATDSIGADLNNWRTWNSGVSNGVLRTATCTSPRCFHMMPGSTDTLLITPNFSLQKDQWYRVAFDLRSTTSAPNVGFVVRRGGGGTSDVERYKSLMGPSGTVSGTTAWKRHVYAFKASDSAIKGDPTQGNYGARLDFGFIPNGNPIEVASVEIVPITSVDATTQIEILSNPEDVPTSISCPISNDITGQCGKFVTIESQSPVEWPISVPAHRTQVIFTREAQLVDSDNDGIANIQDSCPSTPSNLAVNARGCQL